MHAGSQQLLASIRERYWPIKGRNAAKAVVRDCIRCFKAKPKACAPLMGRLPEERIKPSPPFYTTGVDYAGPFVIKNKAGRGAKEIKVYVCLFVCFVTKAIHLEVATDLTANNFIMALRRFISRRGKPSQVFSDNGTNFVGAKNKLDELGRFLVANKNELTNLISQEGIEWHFIPSNSPHFGGLWEAGVRATKFHFKRVASNSFLNYEEFYSLLVQVEAILNSRPLSPLSSDPNDLNPLTPAHFLVGRPLTALPEAALLATPENRLTRYQRIQRLQQQFWSRWSTEYLSELQNRTKWRQSQGAVKEGDLIVIKDERLPPLQWLLGRIVALHAGKDGTARVATIRTVKGELRRPLVKVCPLPLRESAKAEQ